MKASDEHRWTIGLRLVDELGEFNPHRFGEFDRVARYAWLRIENGDRRSRETIPPFVGAAMPLVLLLGALGQVPPEAKQSIAFVINGIELRKREPE